MTKFKQITILTIAVLSVGLVVWAIGSGSDEARFPNSFSKAGVPSGKVKSWEAPVTIVAEPGSKYVEKVILQYHPSGMIYAAVTDFNPTTNKRLIKLFKYDGQNMTFVRNMSDGKLWGFEPDMVIGDDGWIHVTWAEAANDNADNQYIKYCFFDGSSWSDVITLKHLVIPGTVTGNNHEKTDDVRLAVDSEHNLFMAYMVWPAARVATLSRIDGKVYEESCPISGRSKHPCLAVDANYAHLTWIQLLGGTYTVQYARRSKAAGATWNKIIQVGKGTVDRPMIRMNRDGVLQLIYLKTAEGDKARRIYYYYLKNENTFSAYQCVSDQWVELFHPPDIGAFDNNNMIILAQTWAGGIKNYINWLRDGKWEGMYMLIKGEGNETYGTAILNANGIAAIGFSSGSSCKLVCSDRLKVNSLPVAVISTDKDEIFWGESATFNGSGSYDTEGGTITGYQWRIIPDKVTVDGVSVTYKFDKSYGSVKVRLTVTDDNGGNGVAEKTISVKALYTAKSTVTKQMVRTLLYNRIGNVIKWVANAKNAAAGYDIAYYRIFRKTASTDYVQIGEVTSDKFLFADAAIDESETYSYAVTSVDSNGHQSPYNNY
jgi:hypothetical protein